MTLNFDCGNQEALVGYLYDEQEPAERAALAAHLLICNRCAKDVAALRETRAELAAWTPPHVQLGFRLASDQPPPANVLRPVRWWSRPMPAWAQAAAAVLIFSAGLGLGAVRAGTTGRAADTAASAPAAAATVSPGDLAALEQRLRAEMKQLTPSVVPTASATDTSREHAALLQEVKGLVRESEERQQRELALRTAAVVRDFDTQRRGDLARIEQTFGRMEGTTGVQVEQQRQVLNYLMRVAQRQP
jgi:hypothetical protein